MAFPTTVTLADVTQKATELFNNLLPFPELAKIQVTCTVDDDPRYCSLRIKPMLREDVPDEYKTELPAAVAVSPKYTIGTWHGSDCRRQLQTALDVQFFMITVSLGLTQDKLSIGSNGPILLEHIDVATLYDTHQYFKTRIPFSLNPKTMAGILRRQENDMLTDSLIGLNDIISKSHPAPNYQLYQALLLAISGLKDLRERDPNCIDNIKLALAKLAIAKAIHTANAEDIDIEALNRFIQESIEPTLADLLLTKDSNLNGFTHIEDPLRRIEVILTVAQTICELNEKYQHLSAQTFQHYREALDALELAPQTLKAVIMDICLPKLIATWRIGRAKLPAYQSERPYHILEAAFDLIAQQQGEEKAAAQPPSLFPKTSAAGMGAPGAQVTQGALISKRPGFALTQLFVPSAAEAPSASDQPNAAAPQPAQSPEASVGVKKSGKAEEATEAADTDDVMSLPVFSKQS